MRKILTVFIINLILSGNNVYAQKRIVTQDEMEFIQKMSKKTTNLADIKQAAKPTTQSADSVDLSVETPIAELSKNQIKKKKKRKKYLIKYINQHQWLIKLIKMDILLNEIALKLL
jgi:hypothetical protein